MSMSDESTLVVIRAGNVQGVDGQIKRTQYSRRHITLYNNGGTWQVKDHTVTSPAFANLTEQSYYEPPFEIRGVNLDDATETVRILNYDTEVTGQNNTPGSFGLTTVTFKDISERLSTNIIHPIGAVKIWLDSSTTTATLIHLHG